MRLTIAALVLLAGPAFAGFEDSGFSPRVLAMGSAFTAVADDLASIVYNPAALGQIRSVSAQTSYLRQFHAPAGETDQDHFNLAGAFPLKQELFGGTIAAAWLYTSIKNSAKDRATVFSYGTRGFAEFDEAGLELGGTLKFLNRAFASGGGGTTKPAADFGLFYRFGEKYGAGLSVLNINAPGFTSAGQRDRAPATIKLGVSESVRGFTAAFDLTKREPSLGHGPTTNLGTGLERWWSTARFGSLAGRMGLSLGDRTKTYNWGLGWKVFGSQVDYAMTVPLTGASIAGHAVAMSFRFGQSNPEREYERVLSQEMGYRKELSEALEAGEVKRWKLSEELKRQKDELETLRSQLVDKTTSEREAKERIKALQQRHQQSVDGFQKMQAEQKRLSERTKESLFREDWSNYLKAKQGGAPDGVLSDQVKRILLDYKDSGLDLSEANQELLRLLRSQ
ncbi:MAG: hypothetical protein AAB320_02165 [Elusimicrobiota bacterium]